MAEVPKIVLDRLAHQAAAAVSAHPDPDLLTAYGEQAVNAPEREQLVLHLAACRDCRDVLALAAPEPMLAEMPAAVPVMVTVPRRWAPVLRWGAVAAVVVITAGVVMLNRPHPGVTLAPQQAKVAEVQPAAKPPAPEVTLAGPQVASANVPTQAEGSAPAAGAAAGRASAARVQAAPAGESQARVVAKSTVTAAVLPPSGAVGGVMSAAAPAAPARVEVAAERTATDQVAAAREPAGVAGAPAGAPESMVQGRPNTPANTFLMAGTGSSASELNFSSPVPTLLTPAEAAQRQAQQPRGGNLRGRLSLPTISFGAGRGVRSFDSAGVSGQAGSESKASSKPESNFTAPRWTLSADGQVQRTFDGSAWQTVAIAPGVIFTAIAGMGREVWAGGSGGALFHSLDGGTTWMRVIPVQDMRVLKDDIVAVSFTDRQHGTIHTAGAEFWHTSDAGEHWTVHNH